MREAPTKPHLTAQRALFSLKVFFYMKTGRHGQAVTAILRDFDHLLNPIHLDLAIWYKDAFFCQRLLERIYSDYEAHHKNLAKFGDDFTLLLSYPRSGNTLLLNTLTASGCYGLGPPGNFISYNPYCPPADLDRHCIVKEHDPTPAKQFDRILYAVRDGRDSTLSLAYMIAKQLGQPIPQREDFVDMIRYMGAEYKYGGWANNVKRALALKNSGKHDFRMTKYEDFKIDASEDIKFANPVLDAVDMDATQKAGAQNAALAYKLPEWGRPDAEVNEFFGGWIKDRGASHWRSAFSKEAKKAFHETGATEVLLELGYETDKDWWRH